MDGGIGRPFMDLCSRTGTASEKYRWGFDDCCGDLEDQVIFPPEGWRADASTGVVCLTALGGREEGYIEYSERLRPVRRVLVLAAQEPLLPGFAGRRVGPIQRFVTDEGEYAAFVVVEGSWRGIPAECALAYVFGDDFYNRIAGVAGIATGADRIGETVRDIARHDAQFLGQRRRRRFVYEPPTNWQALNVNLETTWFPLDYPRHEVSITVQPAVPAEPGVLVALIAGLGADISIGPDDGRSSPPNRFSLCGQLWRRDQLRKQSPPLHVDVVILRDDTFYYPLRYLGASEGPDRERFVDLVGSVEPIPVSTAQQVGVATIGHWSD